MFHSEMTSLYLGKVDVGVSAGSLVTKYGGLSNCERSIFVRSTVEAGHTFQHHWSCHWLAGGQNRTTFFHDLLSLFCSVSAFLRGKPLDGRQLSETWTPQHPDVWTSESLR